jgi:hypothetical protein
MEEQAFEAQLREIIAKINTLPEPQRAPLMALVEEARQRHAQIKDATARAREALDDWRLIQKYILFDHEARQREARANQDSSGDVTDF